MGKQREQAVGQMTLSIEPGAQAASDQAPSTQVMPPQASTGAETPGSQRKGKWYSLYDKVCKKGTLYQAFVQVRNNKGAPGCDGMTIEQVDEAPKPFLRGLRKELREKRYRPRPVRRCTIAKSGGGERHLGIPTVRDRIVQTALAKTLEPIFEAKFSEHSHGFRPGRGCQTALAELASALADGYEWIVDADIKSFFDTVDHDVLVDAVHEDVVDGSVLRLIEMFLKTGIVVGTEKIDPEEGTPQGGPLSPLLANVYLHPLDEALAAHGYRFVRYADDFVVLAKTQQEAEETLALIKEVLAALALRLNDEKTRIVHIDDGFDFLGFRHFRSRNRRLQRVVRKKAQAKFRDEVRRRTKRHGGQRPRKRENCTLAKLRRDRRLAVMVEVLNRYLRSWLGYFGQSSPCGTQSFLKLDAFVRRRFRSAIIGRYATGLSHSVLTNDLLRALGLTSLEQLFETTHAGGCILPTSG